MSSKIEQIFGVPVGIPKTIPGTAEHLPKSKQQYTYVSDDGTRNFAAQFKRLSANAIPRRAKTGGMSAQGCRLLLPDGSFFHPIGYHGDTNGWRIDIETGAQRLGLPLAQVEQDRFVVSDGRSFPSSECRLELNAPQKRGKQRNADSKK